MLYMKQEKYGASCNCLLLDDIQESSSVLDCRMRPYGKIVINVCPRCLLWCCSPAYLLSLLETRIKMWISHKENDFPVSIILYLRAWCFLSNYIYNDFSRKANNQLRIGIPYKLPMIHTIFLIVYLKLTLYGTHHWPVCLKLCLFTVSCWVTKMNDSLSIYIPSYLL